MQIQRITPVGVTLLLIYTCQNELVNTRSHFQQWKDDFDPKPTFPRKNALRFTPKRKTRKARISVRKNYPPFPIAQRTEGQASCLLKHPKPSSKKGQRELQRLFSLGKCLDEYRSEARDISRCEAACLRFLSIGLISSWRRANVVSSKRRPRHWIGRCGAVGVRRNAHFISASLANLRRWDYSRVTRLACYAKRYDSMSEQMCSGVGVVARTVLFRVFGASKSVEMKN